MNIKIAKIAFITIILLTIKVNFTAAQEFNYKIGFDFNFDNLEGSNPYESTRTYLGVRLTPEIGVKIDDNSLLMGGVSLIKNCGDSIFPTKIDYSIYYKFDNYKRAAILGMFSRENSIIDYSRSFFRDDYKYYNPNIQGLMLQYKNPKSATKAELFCDWYEFNEELRIDAFLIVGGIQHKILPKKLLFTGANILLNHYKNEFVLKDNYLLERFQSDIFLATDLRSVVSTKLDKFEIRAGLLSSSERKRVLQEDYFWNHSLGAQFSGEIGYKGFGMSHNYYRGEKHMIYYSQYGTSFYPGSTFYASGNYLRSNLYYAWSGKYVSVRGDLIFHITPTGMANQQMITLKVRL